MIKKEKVFKYTFKPEHDKAWNEVFLKIMLRQEPIKSKEMRQDFLRLLHDKYELTLRK